MTVALAFEAEDREELDWTLVAPPLFVPLEVLDSAELPFTVDTADPELVESDELAVTPPELAPAPLDEPCVADACAATVPEPEVEPCT